VATLVCQRFQLFRLGEVVVERMLFRPRPGDDPFGVAGMEVPITEPGWIIEPRTERSRLFRGDNGSERAGVRIASGVDQVGASTVMVSLALISSGAAVLVCASGPGTTPLFLGSFGQRVVIEQTVHRASCRWLLHMAMALGFYGE
jgi:hypothetical protein